MNLSRNLLYYGREAGLPTQQSLRAGSLTALFEEGDLRYLKLGEHEVVRRIYWAVRDRNWGTAPIVLSNLVLDTAPNSFRISFDAHCQQNEIDFYASVKIVGTASGEIEFSFEGEARATFLRNRLGLCILHPASVSGAACRIKRVDGSHLLAHFPTLIRSDQPVEPFANLAAISHEVAPGCWAELTFSGDLFEMEDQRNWTDASYKTFCTPLHLPYPVEVRKGTKISQSVRLRIDDARSNTVTATIDERKPITISIANPKTAIPLPMLGLGIASHDQILSQHEIDRLQALNLVHLRVDLWMADPEYRALLYKATTQAQALSLSLEIALLPSENAEAELAQLRDVLDALHPPVCRWLIYSVSEKMGQPSVRPDWIELARTYLASYASSAAFAAGSNNDYIFLNRTPPVGQPFDALTLAINPQVHAFDNASMVETLEAQGILVNSARSIADDKPILVSPVTLKPLFNPYATAAPPPLLAGQLPPQVDTRQMSLFGAVWTLGSLKYLAESGVQSITYYEITGWRGVMESEDGSPAPFPSLPGTVFPLYHVFAALSEFKGGEVIACNVSDPLRMDALLLRKKDSMRLLVANMRAESQSVMIEGLGESVQIVVLDENSAEIALFSPAAFGAQTGTPAPIVNGQVALTLLPYAFARLDGKIVGQ